MMYFFKQVWHETHAFYSSLKIRFTGNKPEILATKGRIFQRKFSIETYYVQKIKKYVTLIESQDKFKKIILGNNVYYWPKSASINSLWIVLSEVFFSKHPHYYNSYPTILEPSYTVLDIGACEGSFCLDASKKVAKVVAIEPSYIMTEAMQLAAREMNLTNIEFVVGLLGSKNGKIGFQENTAAPENSLILDNQLATDFRECWTLDTFINNYFPNGIDYIKCDAEGADYEILKSGRECLIKYKPKIAVAVYHHETDFNKIQIYLESIGYTVQGQGLFYSPTTHKCFPMLLKAY